MIQQNEKFTQKHIRPIWDGSSVPNKVMGKATDKGQQLEEPLDIHT